MAWKKKVGGKDLRNNWVVNDASDSALRRYKCKLNDIVEDDENVCIRR